MRPYVSSIQFVGQNRKNSRMVKVRLSNGTVVKIVPCCEGWEQYNATADDKKLTIPIADRFNDWLHGGELPCMEGGQ